MSLFSKLFKNKEKMETKTFNNTKKLTLDEINFSQISNQEFELYWDKRMKGEISDNDYDTIRRKCTPHCKMSVLAENEIVLYRMAKSSESIASKSIEQRKFIEHKISEIVSVNNSEHGLSLTTPENLLTCIPYGDVMIQVKFDTEKLKLNNMMDDLIYRSNSGLDEYVAMRCSFCPRWTIRHLIFTGEMNCNI